MRYEYQIIFRCLYGSNLDDVMKELDRSRFLPDARWSSCGGNIITVSFCSASPPYALSIATGTAVDRWIPEIYSYSIIVIKEE